MADVRWQALSGQRFQAVLLGLLAGLALLLAAVGVYGVVASSVAERTRELGLRMALGASSSRAIATVAWPAIAMALAGTGLGCLLALSATGLLRSLIWGVSSTDPATFAGAAAVLAAVAALATLVPALRIVRLNPAETLRQD